MPWPDGPGAICRMGLAAFDLGTWLAPPRRGMSMRWEFGGEPGRV